MSLFKQAEPKTVEVYGHSLTCPICAGKQFWTKEVVMNTAISTFFHLDWTDRSATCFVCADCTYIFWFLGK